MQSNAQTDKNTVMQNAIALYIPKQIYDLEKNWFRKNDSFALMQQAAWQLAHIIKKESSNQKGSHLQKSSHTQKSVLVVAGAGNNGGDAWLVAHYVNKLCPNWSVIVVQVAAPTTLDSQTAKHLYQSNCANAAKYLTLTAFLQPLHELGLSYQYDVVIDGFAGCGGNTIAFARTCAHVIAIDNNRARLEMARHNAGVYGVAHKIEYDGDSPTVTMPTSPFGAAAASSGAGATN